MDTSHVSICLGLTRAIGSSRTVEQIYDAALDALAAGLGVSRSAILLFDPDGVMRFKAHRGLSDAYRQAVEGHTPWPASASDPQPIVVADVAHEPSLRDYLPIIQAEGIAAMAFLPMVTLDRAIGKFMVYYDAPHALGLDELQLAGVIAAQVAFALERRRAEQQARRAEEQARRSEERLRFALESASMGTWDWDIQRNTVEWSDNLERLHGLPPDSFDGGFASYEREVHPDDRARVLASLNRAIAEGVPHDVEYRIVAPDGSIRWVEGKGRVEYVDGRPVRMTGVCVMATRRKEVELARLAGAEEASQLKDEFLATLSHELRTPLNAIVGWVQMLQLDPQLPAEARAAVDVIGRNARLQAQLIEDILDVSRIITGKLDIERRPVPVAHLIETSVAGIQPAADKKQITVTTAAPGAIAAVFGDPKRLHQVLGNILSNAVKFTPEGGRVSVRCVDDGPSIRIQVEDSGAGIDSAFLPYVFDRFRQADSRSTRKHGGLGLGLAIARHLIEQHGGDIRAESEGPGRGTVITIRLPASAVRKDAASEGARLSGVRPASHDPLLAQATVVVVDDETDSRELLAALFERCGAEVVQCESASAALDAVKSRRIQLMVADLAMPDVDGYELIRHVRALEPHLPAVAVSACARSEDRGRALSSGYSDYCAKPIERAQLLASVRNAMRA